VKTIALFGAGGKIGFRCAVNLKDSPYRVHYIEVSRAGIDRLAAAGFAVTPRDRAIEDADVTVLAVPDNLIGSLARQIVPRLRSGAMVLVLDAAVAYAGGLPTRADISYFVSHPCHPGFPIQEDDAEP
jgi:D-apionate oxidoisomerase